MNIKEVSELIEISVSTIKRQVEKGIFPPKINYLLKELVSQISNRSIDKWQKKRMELKKFKFGKFVKKDLTQLKYKFLWDIKELIT